VLRVCADPNNLPFSNQREEGFENRLARLIAADLHATVEYTWWAQRRGFVRETVSAGSCDVVTGVPTQFERTLVTRPYYRSSYVFVTRRDRHLALRTFDDPGLKTLRIGVQLIGEDGQNTPPAHALAARHIINNVVGYTVYGDYLQPNPPARIVDAVSRGDVDVAVVWGPLAGYFARRQTVPLDLAPVAAVADPATPVAFDISVGVARRAPELRDEIDRVLVRRHADIEQLLGEYGVPRVKSSCCCRSPDASAKSAASAKRRPHRWRATSPSVSCTPAAAVRRSGRLRRTNRTPTRSAKASGCSAPTTAAAATPMAVAGWARR
jgi:quinoprotein dehydrogenase-associated probable ABC transporter substrate-binding protein